MTLILLLLSHDVHAMFTSSALAGGTKWSQVFSWWSFPFGLGLLFQSHPGFLIASLGSRFA